MGYVGGRGTSRRSVKDLRKEKDNWAGEKYKEHQKDVKNKAGDAYVTVGRGTKKIKLSEIKESKAPSAKGHYVSMGRGTGRRKVE